VLRKIFGPKRDKITGKYRTLNEKIHDLYSLTKYYEGEMGGASGTYGEEERCKQGFGGKETTRATYAYTEGKY
jgi:hypothetical protein